jgi:hypothetical protein
MPVRPRPDLLPKYVLVLLTANNEGAWHFADSLGKAGVEWSIAWQKEQESKAEAKGSTPTLFSVFIDELTPESYVADHAAEWTRLIARNIDSLLDDVGSFLPADRVPEVYGTTLGQASTPHVRAAVKALHREKKVANSAKATFGRRF